MTKDTIEENLEAIKNHYTNLDITDLPMTTYRKPIYFGKFKNQDGSICITHLVLKEEQPTYVITGSKMSLETNTISPLEYEVKAEIPKTEEIDEFVYELLQDETKSLEDKIDLLMSTPCMHLSKKLPNSLSL